MRKSNHFPKRWSAPSLALICAICFAAASVFSLAPAASSFQCGYCVTPASKAFSSASDTGAVSVVAPDGCGWTAESNSSFITITQGSGGTGNGTVRYAIEANPTNAPRTGTITVAGQAVTIMQDAACTPRPAGLVAWWPGDGNPNNIAGPSRATLQTGAAFNSGQVKQAFSFDGTDDFVSTDLDVQPAAIASTTWEAWVFPTRLNHAVRQTILSGDDGGLDRAVTIEPLSSSFGVFTGAGIWQPADVSLNEWQHVAVVYTPTNIEFYKNGVRFSLGSAPFGQASSARLHFGKAPNANDFFKGRIDEVSIYNRALAESEITTIFNAGAGGKCRWIDFADVPQSHIFFREIRSISAQAITLGCDPNNFCPDLVVTRGQMAAFIIRALGMPNPPEPAQQRFADVPPSNPFYRFIEQMAVLGITQGCDADNYCPDDPVLRDQMAAFIIRALGIINPPQPAQQNFIDVPPTNFFFASIEQMRLRGITLGCAAAMYCPSDPVTRSQMAAFLFRGFGQNTNQFPAVFAGQDQTVWLPGAASLSGMINDDGLPDCGALMATWSQVSGPGTVTFSNPNSEATAASFSQPGTYVLRLTAVDSQLSNFDEVTITVNPPDPGNQPPSVNTGPDQAITLPSGASLNATVTDDGNPAGGLSVSWITVSGPGAVIFGNASAPATTAIFSVEGSYVLRLTASDSQLSSFDEVTITVNPDPVPPPPDPMTVAPPIDSSVVTTIGAATEFLYTGPSPIQTGVAPGAIKMERAAVLRGRVIDRNGTPVPKAKISVLNHPEFGQTLSRADGRFDMVVNGGGILTVKYEKVGCLPVQRQADVPWQEYVVVDDVAIVCYDAQVTRLDLSANIPIQVAQGSTVIDEDGRRRATLLFRQGTTATMKLPDGTMQGLTRLHVRATEYTVGERGPEAMPGDLPATSAYTYALEYSVDEAVAAGATQVNFSQPVISYEQNFLGFPTGLSVPTGFYDRESGRWVPSVSGRVVKILSISNGRVNMDLDGSNLPASDAAYAALGITVAERQRLATLFSAGQSLWRTPLSHFSPWDKNWAFGPPADAKPPNTKPPKCDKPTNCPTTRDGSIIGCESQTLGEVVEVTGTPFSLNYNTGRVPGRKASYTLTIPLSDSSIPASVARIDLEVTIAGRKFTQSFPRQTNLTTTFTWDGKDAYGRTMQGAQRAVVRISYVYQGVYQQTNNFGYNGNGVAIFGNPTRQEVLLPTSFVSTVGALDARASGLGGWTLDVHHAYDPIGQVLYLGNGDSRSIDEAPRTISTIAGGVTVDCVVTPHLCQDGVPANRVPLHGPVQIAVDAQGSVYVVENGIPRVRKVTTAGLIFTVAGTGVHGYNGDNIPAVNAQLNIPSGVAVDPMGNVFIGDFNNRRIRKINTAGIITTIAGTGIAADDCADPQNPCPPIPAITANLCGPGALVLDRNGNLYFQDCSRIKKIDPAGNLTTVVFDGAAPAVDTQGNLYYTDFGRTRVVKLSTDNQLTVVAGGNGIGTGGDGGPATQANIECVNHMSFDRQGNLYISQQGCSPGLNRLRVVTPEGFINTFAGLSTMGYGGDGGTARAAGFFHLLNIVEDALGNIYIGDNGGGNVGNIRKVTPFLPSFSANEMVIASEDARELYVFNPAGRHLRTLHALTGATLYEFTYDSAGWLTQVTDGDNNITTIERNGAGNVTGILSPFGQRTALTMDAGGFLASIA
ncbi:MAG TPA: LamG-like jellyroll fold domain-containing protein, partial [Blastocatellia bacterium]|nr:LamG-like jellyroll fold domain-containing protein [Blastocatellia bacterium]